ncbi:hypothetical protein PRIPAC_71400 [Pristionchus pacificus]|uniref:Uncharacterized protein n=1 Tax=Pristionchus pacificus TaxID=54126 RepID=A0A2A6BFN1_PRIPA|nr:hypothetical protein PRIPAC_71400 [Pristionchus pacificus]|eukprot:PDM64687.1 hypothetical protein PRIPAC_52943 [Pristionchus pacificus]
MSSTSSVYSTPSSSPQDLIRVSCAKMVVAKQEKGGGRLHKNLLVLHLLKKARDSSGQESRMAGRGRRVLPLEHYVNDENDYYQDTKQPLVVAREATEEDESSLPIVRSCSLDRKRSSTPSIRSGKKRVIPSYLRPLTCKS